MVAEPANPNATWGEANQAYLLAALARLKQRLAEHAGRSLKPQTVPPQSGDPAAFSRLSPTLERITRAFALSPFERDVLLLVAGVELDSELAGLCAAAQGDSGRSYPTFSLALAALSEPHWSALAPDAPLRHWRLIEVPTGVTLTAAPLRIDERVLHFLTGVAYFDERLTEFVRLLPGHLADSVPQSHAAIANSIAVAISDRSVGAMPVVQLCGDPRDGLPIAVAVARQCGVRAAAFAADLAPTAASELDVFIRLWQREAPLGGIGVLVIEGESLSEAARAREQPVARLIDRVEGPVIVCDPVGRRLGHRTAMTFDIQHPLPAEQREAWRRGLEGASDAAVDRVAAQFSLSITGIEGIAQEARARAASRGAGDVTDIAWDLCRMRLRVRLEGLARRVASDAGWDQLVLPAPQTELLRSIATQLRQRITVHERWGFAARTSRGLGITALFHGRSGTGKTFAAEVLANDLKLDLYRIDLSAVVSKYIGETEANLRRVFDAAEESGAILLFDEADALFGKRSEVRDSHDRYANMEVSYLLQRMEAYRGLAVLTTNMNSSIDSAFLRRIRFVVEFPFPDEAEREAIWRRIFPAATPTEGLDWSRLAALRIPGGNIRNIALNAAFLAAGAGEPVRMSHVMAATRTEYTKNERTLTASELGVPIGAR